MRKRIVSAQIRTVAIAVSLILLVAACDRTSDTRKGTSVGSGRGGVDSGTPVPMAPAMAAQSERRSLSATAANAPPARDADMAAPAVHESELSFGASAPADPSGAMLIRNGQASVEVSRLNDAMTKVRQMAAQYGGFVANMSLVGGKDENRSAQLEIRVPSAQFDAAVVALGTLGKVESIAASVQDAGDEYVDLGARAANARRTEARLAEMLAQRTGKLSEVLTVEQELRRVREEIERYDARLKWLERKASMSSLQVTLHEKVSVLDQPGPSPIAEAFAEAWQRAVGMLAWCIAALGVLVPVALFLGGLVFVARRLPPFKASDA